MIEHERTAGGGESTARWAFRQPGFIGTVRQLTACARCGDPLRPLAWRKVRDAGTPAQHVICDECFDALPE